MPAPPATWKSVERRVARFLGAERNPLSGGNSKHTRSDSLHPFLFVETKHGAGCPTTWEAVMKLFNDTETKAWAEHKLPLVVLHPKGFGRVEMYPAYMRCPDGTMAGAIVQLPLGSVKMLIDSGRLVAPPKAWFP